MLSRLKSETKRVLFYNHTGQVSGGEQMLLLILRNLRRSVLEPIVACPDGGPLAEACREMGVEVYGIGSVGARFTLRPDRILGYAASIARASADLRDVVRLIRPDVVHANSVRSGLVADWATLRLNIPVVWHVHDILPNHPLTSVIRLLAQSSNRIRVIACSAAAAGSLRKAGTRIIPNGIELNRFQFRREMDVSMREAMGIGPGQFVIGTVGQIAERKGQVALVEAFADALRSIPNAIMVIVGTPLFEHDQEYAALVQSRVRDLGLERHVRFLGQRSDIPELMHAFDAFVLNSTNETFGLVLAEAMASGTPVIATRAGGVPEIVTDAETGRLVDVGDRQGLTKAMVEFATNKGLCSGLAANARNFVVRHLSATRYVRDVESFYGELLHFEEAERLENSYAEAI